MKQTILITIITTLSINGAMARSALLESLERNIYTANAILTQEQARFDRAKASLNASKDKLKSAQRRFKEAKADERKEAKQLRKIAEANAEYYQIPDYEYRANSTGIKW